ncbi:FAD-dependent oxidoreductase [Actibacterium ureilyticum]|uniref:FAD-dependent oxidoreductase n=1 Tax=Actibacterium ureilyticum TaxID=1590614 RepID=UPI000BAAEE6D|nr:FAD-dependent oxidoreductase [Actibacterium ureilyticum]
MKRATLSELSQKPYDLLVVGGGIYGVMAARDAALRGLRTAIVDGGDWGGQTSYNSLKLMHGGIRYVQHLDFARLRASARERAFWQRAGADVVTPLDFAIPMQGYGIKGPIAFGIAAQLYNLASAGLRGPHYGLAHAVGPRKARALMQDLAPADLTGGGVWRDGQIQDGNRLLLAALRAATDAGADAANHVLAEEPILHQGRVIGARLSDRISGGTAEVRAKVTLSCTGGAAAGFAAHVLPDGAAQQVFPKFARAMNLVIDRKLCARGIGIISRSRSDAVVDRGGRMYFLTPWQGRTIIGTHESPYVPGTDGHMPDPAQVQAFLDEINFAAPSLNLGPEDVAFCYSGLIPADIDDAAKAVQRQTRGTLIDHARHGGPAGLISSVGVKYTTARLIAERAVDLAMQQLDRPAVASQSFDAALPIGAPGYDPDQPAAPQVARAVTDDMACTLEDLLFRRSLLAERGLLRGTEGRARIDAAASAMAHCLSWDETARESQVQGVLRTLRQHKYE